MNFNSEKLNFNNAESQLNKKTSDFYENSTYISTQTL